MAVENILPYVLQKKVSEFEKMKNHFEELKQQVTSLEEAKGWLERSLKKTEVGEFKYFPSIYHFNYNQNCLLSLLVVF